MCNGGLGRPTQPALIGRGLPQIVQMLLNPTGSRGNRTNDSLVLWCLAPQSCVKGFMVYLSDMTEMLPMLGCVLQTCSPCYVGNTWLDALPRCGGQTDRGFSWLVHNKVAVDGGTTISASQTR